jgi:hypothetical protein
MKKILSFALMALLIFPLMTGCKPKNPATDPGKEDPQQPKTEEDMFIEWTSPKDSSSLETINVQGLYGIWRLTYQAQVQKGQTTPFWSWSAEYQSDSVYSEISGSKTWIDYYYYSKETESGGSIPLMSLTSGTWNFTAPNKLTVAMEGYALPFNYILHFVEEDRFVYYEEFKNPETGISDFQYMVYTRVMSLPPIPEAPKDRMTQHAWKATSDTITIYNLIREEKDNVITYREEFLEKKVNQLPSNCVFTFDESEHLLNITDKDNMLISQYRLSSEIGGNDPTQSGYIELEYIKGEDLLPGRNIVFYPNLDDAKKAYFNSQYTKTDYDEKEGKEHVQNWYYHINVIE